MIRRRLRRRWQYGLSDGQACFRAFWILNHWLWIDRYFAWEVGRYGETPGHRPLLLRPVTRLVLWADEWRLALSMRLGSDQG